MNLHSAPQSPDSVFETGMDLFTTVSIILIVVSFLVTYVIPSNWDLTQESNTIVEDYISGDGPSAAPAIPDEDYILMIVGPPGTSHVFLFTAGAGKVDICPDSVNAPRVLRKCLDGHPLLRQDLETRTIHVVDDRSAEPSFRMTVYDFLRDHRVNYGVGGIQDVPTP